MQELSTMGTQELSTGGQKGLHAKGALCAFVIHGPPLEVPPKLLSDGRFPGFTCFCDRCNTSRSLWLCPS